MTFFIRDSEICYDVVIQYIHRISRYFIIMWPVWPLNLVLKNILLAFVFIPHTQVKNHIILYDYY